jgi:hypothetical protein
MTYTLTRAAEATGKSKSTILRAIKAHKLSAMRDELTQGWLIEPAELHRVYPVVVADDEPDAAPRGGAALREIELMREMLADKDRQIESLSRRLESVDEERRTTLRQLTAILTDQREKAIIPPPPAPAAAQTPAPAKRRWWQRGGQG